MKEKILLIVYIFLITACQSQQEGDLLTIPVNTNQKVSFPLSTIAEEIIPIELELTNESLIKRVLKVILADDYIIVAERNKIMLFDLTGKFIREIGSVGEGPGEFTGIMDLTLDKKTNHLFISSNKITCYNLNGDFIKESLVGQYINLKSIHYINDELLAISERIRESDGKNTYNQALLVRINDDFQVTDSIEIRKVYDVKGFWIHPWIDFISYDGQDTYLYFSEQNPEPILRDTLYQLIDNQLIPYLKLGFKNNGIGADGMKYIYLYNIYKSSRFVFSVYGDSRENEYYRFCYDLKTKKGYNMADGYTDDINTGEIVDIRPFESDPERFYYHYTNMNPDDPEEPNPTLYIGTLKK